MMRLRAASRYAALALWGAPWAVHGFRQTHTGHQDDWDWIRFGSKALYGIEPYFHDGRLHLYADMPQLQVGPPALLVNGLFQWAAGRTGGYGGDVLVLVLCCLLGLSLVAMIESFAGRWHPKPQRAVTLAALLLLPVWFNGFGTYGHLEDAFVYTAVAASFFAIERQQPLMLGALLGLAVASKPWAIILIPLVLALRKRQAVLLSSLTALVVFSVFWLPFLLTDPVTAKLGKLPFPVSDLAPLHTLGLVHAHVNAPLWVRPVQMVVGMALVALAARGDWVAAPFVGLLWRVTADPEVYMYYGVGPAVAAVILDARRGGFPYWTTTTVSTLYIYYAAPDAAALARLALGLLALPLVTWRLVHAEQAPALTDTQRLAAA